MKTESTSPTSPPTAPPVPNGTAGSAGNRKPPVIRVAQRRRPVVLPLMPSDKPGSVDMTAERIAETLEKQDVWVPPYAVNPLMLA